MDHQLPSRHFDWGGLLRTALLGGAAAVVLGFVGARMIYGLLSLKILVLQPFLLGGIVGAILQGLAGHSRLRNPILVGLLGGGAGLLALYGAWVGALWPLTKGRSGLVLDPRVLWGYMQVMYAEGVWVLEHGRRLRGGPLLVLWLAEAGTVIGLAAYLAKKGIQDAIWCADCRRWCKVEACILRLACDPQEDRELLDRLSTGDLEALDALTPTTDDDAPACVQLDLTACPICGQTNYLSIKLVQQGYRADGEFFVFSDALVPHRAVSEGEIQHFRHLAAAAQAAPSEPSAEVGENPPG